MYGMDGGYDGEYGWECDIDSGECLLGEDRCYVWKEFHILTSRTVRILKVVEITFPSWRIGEYWMTPYMTEQKQTVSVLFGPSAEFGRYQFTATIKMMPACSLGARGITGCS